MATFSACKRKDTAERFDQAGHRRPNFGKSLKISSLWDACTLSTDVFEKGPGRFLET
jgi:hypothetical protein